MRGMDLRWIIFAVLLWPATPVMAASVSEDAPKQTPSAMIFLPPGASYCRDFLRLEPMQKYESGSTSFSQGEAEDYFAYRGVEEWVRGFFTAANIFHVQNGSGDATKGSDPYGLMPRLFEYCRSHRDEVFSSAALQLLKSLGGIDRLGKRELLDGPALETQ